MAREKAWVDLIPRDALEKAWVTRVDLGGRVLAVYDTPSGLFASAALCNHGGADLCDGYFDGHVIECPLHQGAFDVRDGRPVGAPAVRRMLTYEVRERGGMVQVRI
ncbi:non-heme iron oxygenase ferredoxin subunit [Gymnodinialimonas ceratoperidinii]|uniref:Non-heme iron oxygenase ferredoxin subunit n=1 Tax=Gymnodinialimonas ceratoperidinii TaxID=2856823 RepID=A0A8F6TYY7_9RHOB|nr:non-heme iron oxygenase ferredoxin subunit [Gymnodinialimonas ceratoperidinii]QXT40291.1 non-heme iron oxygenase ferredoxin subunit [Gymnodinialimonas ceratoperidinii]